MRPSLPPLLLLGLGVWAGTAGAYAGAARLDAGALPWLAGGALALVAAVLVLWLRCGARPAACLGLGVALGVLCGLAGAIGVRAQMLAEPSWGTWRLELIEDARPADRGWRALARADDGAGRDVTVSLALPEDGAGLLAGDVLEARATLRPVGEDAGGYSWQRGVGARATVASWELLPAEGPLAPVRALRRAAIGALGEHGGEAAPLMQALACGYRAPLDEQGGYGAWQACGLAHLVAVSGAHLTLVALCAEAALRALRLPRPARQAVLAALVGGYLVFSGLPVSALRAGLMAASSAGALLARRRPAALAALGACLVAFPALDPPTALSASFALSAGSTLGIILLAGLVASWLAPLPAALRRTLGDPAALTIASATATQPYAAALFAQLPLISLPANVIAAPLFTLACLGSLLSAAAAVALPGAAPAAVALGAASTRPLAAAVGALASVPGGCVPVDAPVLPMVAFSAAAVALLYCAWPRPRLGALLAGGGALAATAILALALAPLAAPTQVVMLDVGQGDAILVRSRGAALLVDTGNQDRLLLRALARQGVWRLDAVAVTHGDDDHCGSLGALGQAVEVGRVLVAADALTCPCASCARLRADAAALVGADAVAGLAAGDELSLGAFALRVAWPRAFADEGGNGDSLCLLAAAGEGAGRFTALLTGDAEADQLRAMADGGAIGAVDVLKVGHHGSAASLDGELACRLAPAVALVSVGEGNRYGHPRPEPLAALEAAGARVFRTDESGDVAVTFDAGRLRVDSQRPAGETRVE